MKILVTGAAGFIGYYLVKKLVENGYYVVSIDNLNNYYDINLKKNRLRNLGIEVNNINYGNAVKSSIYNNCSFVYADISDKPLLEKTFLEHDFDYVCNLAAQAGVRYSLENPDSYIQSNIVGFLNILECCRHHKIKHLIYASSSSVYGLNKKQPFSTEDNVDFPISLYAASKKSNELMAHSYSHLFNFATTGLRFFTVYGPWGRPDMAPMLFANAICQDKPIKVFNHGNLERDFTYIDDIITGVYGVIAQYQDTQDLYKIYNIGNNNPVKLLDFIETMEIALSKKAIKEFLPMQSGDVYSTYADIDPLKKDYGYIPLINIQEGISKFASWFLDYYKVKK